MDKINYFGIVGQENSEEKTKLETKESFNEICENFELYIDLLFKISYFVEKFDEEIYIFESYCFDYYVQLPYTFKCLYNNFLMGYYSEAFVLIRHLYEIFISMRYFQKHKDRLGNRLILNKNNKLVKIRIVDMFNEFDDGNFYEKYYGDMFLSKFVHGKPGYTVFRTERPEHKKYVNGNKFEVDYANWVLTDMIALVYGFANYFDVFFPNNDLKRNEDVLNLYTFTMGSLELYMHNHQINDIRSKVWYETINKFIGK
ncbi:hypothetical protein [Desulfosporosinus nitroreducens]|uniref:hypothetical protein n=1 Tax=Desulfosporosinus nitroreducens TaxID=2018668 RepID=UPI00207CEC1E|nr:hypothetical protein [Desulfosporosinus nitroreducens]MCO1604544.1 hypothetical protein [Desulfosporosinus nitroreducens]